MKEKIKLSGVPETMLQTIYARAKESGGRGTIHTNAFLKRLIIYHCCCTMKMVMRNEKIHFHA